MTQNGKMSVAAPGRYYQSVWRWHFMAGMVVIPFLFMLTFSGLLMLLSKPLDSALNADRLTVAVGDSRVPVNTLLHTVEQQYPHYAIKLYLPPQAPTQSTQFSLQPHSHAGHGGHHAPATLVYLNPYTGEILGDRDPATSLYARIKTFHGSLFMGGVGDALIEMAAGLAVLMIVTGLYLAWPKQGWRALLPRPEVKSRLAWRQWHLTMGWLIALPLVFFLISGLAWTNVWGGKIVQPWGSLPGTRYVPQTETAPSARDHSAMNEHGVHRVPWALEQTPMPVAPTAEQRLTLDDVVNLARAKGFGGFRVHFPQQSADVWTVSATTIAGDITDPGQEWIVHLDPATGETLQAIRFADYPAMGKAMATSIPFHQGDLGPWNWWLNLLFVCLILVLIVTGGMLWWKRQTRRVAPSAPQKPALVVATIMLLVALLFPLSALAMLVLIAVDVCVLRRGMR